jgi:hypothetical protein
MIGGRGIGALHIGHCSSMGPPLVGPPGSSDLRQTLSGGGRLPIRAWTRP